MSKYKKFGKSYFKRTGVGNTKKMASKLAKKMKSLGFKTRIVKRGKKYDTYYK